MVFDESDEALVYIGYKIATFTYGGLLGIFLISHINDRINSIQIVIGLISSIISVILLLEQEIAWTLYILISLITFIVTSHLSYFIFKFIRPLDN